MFLVVPCCSLALLGFAWFSLVRLGEPWSSGECPLVFLGVPWYSSGIPYCSVIYLGVPWCSLVDLGVP